MRKHCLWMKSILALCLCVALLAGTACAEEVHIICSGKSDYLNYDGTLPDGRVLLTGGKDLSDESYHRGGWVLCLNPDRTVSWEIVDEEYYEVRAAAILPDGTIGVVFENRQMMDREDRITIRFYTPDGKATGRELELSTENVIYEVNASWLMAYTWKAEKRMDETVLFDWDGNELLRYDGLILPGGYGYTVENAEELVFFGQDTMEHSHAKILKLDGLTGKTLWETTLDWQLPDTVDARLEGGIKTEDGGYIAWLEEGSRDTEDEPYVWKPFLVKFGADGRVQRIIREIFEKVEPYGTWLYSVNGKTAVRCMPETDGNPDTIAPWVFLWLDEDGNEIGTTEVKLDIRDFPDLGQFVGPAGDGTRWEPSADLWDMIPMADGLWALGSCCVDNMDSSGNFIQTLSESFESFLVKIPEP